MPGGFRQFAPILARFAPRVMAVQAAPAERGDAVNLSLHLRGHPGRTAWRPAGTPTASSSWRSTPTSPGRPASRPGTATPCPLDAVDVLVEADGEPFALDRRVAATEVDAAIAGHVLEYVEEGSTLQTGIGAVPNLVATRLAEAPGGGYGVHSEMFTDGLMRLHEAGKVTNTGKGELEGVSVTTFALGSAELYRWLDGEREVAFLPVDVVNDQAVAGGNAKLLSINGALCVDLYGQIVADHVGGRQISGVGGHEDFVAAPELHLDSHSLVCLASTVTVGEEVRSRIVPVLPPAPWSPPPGTTPGWW